MGGRMHVEHEAGENHKRSWRGPRVVQLDLFRAIVAAGRKGVMTKEFGKSLF